MVFGIIATLVATVIISGLLAPRLENQDAATLSDFTLPTAEPSRAVSVVFGTVMVEGPNIVWMGDFEADPIRRTTGLKIRGLKISKRRATVGYRYSAGIHFVISHSVERLLAIFVDNRIISTHHRLTENHSVEIRLPNRFGGREGNGGLLGGLDVLYGRPDQGPNEYLESQVNFVPGYRGFLSVILKSFYLGNSPMFAPWSFLCQRVTQDLDGNPIWYEEKAAIAAPGGTARLQEFIDEGLTEDGEITQNVEAPTVIDQNPAHIIYTVLTELIGVPVSEIDDQLFREAADILYDEGFGLSYVWDDSEDYERFLQRVVDHIDGTLHIDPVSGQWGLYLIRTIDPDEIEATFDESNATLTEFDREGYGELFSEVIIRTVDRFSGDTIGVRETNPALARIQGGNNGTEQTFAMAFERPVIQIIASRNRLFYSFPKCSGVLDVDHSQAFRRYVGEPFYLSSEKYGFTNLQCRVTAVNFQRFDNMRAGIEFIQDYRAADSVVPFTSGDNTAQQIEVADPAQLFNARPVPFDALVMQWGFLNEEDILLDRFSTRLIMADDETGAPHIGFSAQADGEETIQTADFSDFYRVVFPSPRGDTWIDDSRFDASNIPREDLELGDALINQIVQPTSQNGINFLYNSEVVIVADLSEYPIVGVRRGAFGSKVFALDDPLDTAWNFFNQMVGTWLPNDFPHDRQGDGQQIVSITPVTQTTALDLAQAVANPWGTAPSTWFLPPASLTINGDKWPIFADLTDAVVSYVVFDPMADIDGSITSDAQTAGIAAPLYSVFQVREFLGNALLYEERFTGGNTARVDAQAMYAAILENSASTPPNSPEPLVMGWDDAGLTGINRINDTRIKFELFVQDEDTPTNVSEVREHVTRGGGGWGHGWGTLNARMFSESLLDPAGSAPAGNTIPTGFDFSAPDRTDTVELGPRSFRNPAGYVTYGFENVPPVTGNGAYYLEWQHAGTRNDNGSVGFQQAGVSLNSWLGSAPTGVGIYDDGEVYIAATIRETVPFTLGARVGAALIIDGDQRRIQYYMDGVASGPEILITADPAAGDYVPAATSRSNELVSLFTGSDANHAPAGTTPWPEYQDPAQVPTGNGPAFTTNERFAY